MDYDLDILPDIESLNRKAAERFISIGNETIKQFEVFTVALSGGSTPKPFYRLLATEFKDQIDWTSVLFFLVDERNVLEDDAESNFRMINEMLFEPLQIGDVFPWNAGENDVETTAENYEKTMLLSVVEIEGERYPWFDLIILGMGADGHTASLFPYTEALDETKRFAVANKVEKLQTTRLTMTFPAINHAENVMFMVSGAEKAETLREVLQGEYDPEKFPAQKVKPKTGNLLWLVDAQAARLLQ